MKQENTLYVVPVSLQEANDFLAKYSRQYWPMCGCKFSVGRAAYGMLYGAAARAVQALGYCRIIAFPQSDKPDSVLRTAGRHRIEYADGSRKWAKTLHYERRLMVRRRWKEMKP